MSSEPGRELMWRFLHGECNEVESKMVEQYKIMDPAFKLKLDRMKSILSQELPKSKTNPDRDTLKDDSNDQKTLSDCFAIMVLLSLIFYLLFL